MNRVVRVAFLTGGPGSDLPLCVKWSPTLFFTFLWVFLKTAAWAAFAVREDARVVSSVSVSGSSSLETNSWSSAVENSPSSPSSLDENKSASTSSAWGLLGRTFPGRPVPYRGRRRKFYHNGLGDTRSPSPATHAVHRRSWWRGGDTSQGE